MVAALRASGLGNDPGATAGASAPSQAWVVTPTVAGEPSRPGLVLMNPGSDPVEVTLHLLPPKGAAPAADVALTMPCGERRRCPDGLPGVGTDRQRARSRSSRGGVMALGACRLRSAPKTSPTTRSAMGAPIPPSP